MNGFKVLVNISLLVLVLCPIFLSCETRGDDDWSDDESEEDLPYPEKPCDVCPRHAKCVPKIQCPAHVRPGSYNPLCHLGKGGAVGVCCFTGCAHAAESDRKSRSSASISVENVKSVHSQSRKKLKDWLLKTNTVLSTVRLNVSTPSYGHHMIMVSADPKSDDLCRGGLENIFALKILKSRQAISDEDVSLGFTHHTDAPYCPAPPSCPKTPQPYRTAGGECNHATYTHWGAVDTGFQRLLPPDYNDGIWEMRTSKAGGPLPGARYVSSNLILDSNFPSDAHNLMFMQFGQFISHDISKGTVFTAGNGSAISCCANNGEQFLPKELLHEACAPIASGPSDPFFSKFNIRCHNFVRIQLAPAADCTLGYATQMNTVSHFIDLSQLYGNSDSKISEMRAPGGLLATFNDYGREMPPLTKKQQCLFTTQGAPCFESGDGKANQLISLTLMHTIWTREHNRVARALKRLNPNWDDNKVFLEARRIVQAEFQHIIYSEWLPLLLGPDLMQMYGLFSATNYGSSYDPNVNPSITAEFVGAAFRFGHSTVQGKFNVPNLRNGKIHEIISLPEVMLQPSRLRLRFFLDRLIAGLSYQPMQSVDPFVTIELTLYMFRGGNPFGVDLASLNIQRGRDFGVRTYNDYRRLIGLDPLVSFNEFSANAAQRLASVYQTPEDVDLWVGCLLEEPMYGSIVGPTFAHIIADQFSKLKRGDRYFYENGPDVNPGAFTPGQLSEIKKVSFARILCDNKDGIELTTQSPNAFVRPDIIGNEPVTCDSFSIPIADLSRFKEI